MPALGLHVQGKNTLYFKDGKETVSAGEAYYPPPAHKFEVLEDTETIEFSPAIEYKQHMEKVARNMQGASAGNG